NLLRVRIRIAITLTLARPGGNPAAPLTIVPAASRTRLRSTPTAGHTALLHGSRSTGPLVFATSEIAEGGKPTAIADPAASRRPAAATGYRLGFDCSLLARCGLAGRPLGPVRPGAAVGAGPG